MSHIYKDYNFFDMDGKETTMEDLIINDCLQGKVAISEGIVVCKKTNKHRYREFRGAPIWSKDGQIKEIVISSINIEERLEREEALIESEKNTKNLVEELKKIDKERLEFLSSLSHELRNPLATINMGLDLMTYLEDKKDEEERLIETLKRQTKQLGRLVDDLLNMTRISQNKFELSLERLELNQLLEEIIEDSMLFFKEKRIQVDKNINQNKILIEGDASRLRQVIENILHNASKFTPSNGRVTILLKKDLVKNEAITSIKDTGEGMSKELIRDIFKPYVQTMKKRGQSMGGLGIGLSIARDVVERHRGYIQVLSKGQGKGTEFIIKLPLLEDSKD